uniref:Uncharacterized protein n=1 Tax=Acrobeloides nanus TaxID=290746 RepID=A0A914EPK5_9BILA
METWFTINDQGEVHGTTKIDSTLICSGFGYSGFDFDFVTTNIDSYWQGTMRLVLFSEKHHIIENFEITHCIHYGDCQEFAWKEQVQAKNIPHIKGYSISYDQGVQLNMDTKSQKKDLEERPNEVYLRRRNAITPNCTSSNGFKHKSKCCTEGV